jgi:hypothetical protein
MPLRFSISTRNSGQHPLGPAPIVIMAAIPLGVGGEPRLRLGEASLAIL